MLNRQAILDHPFRCGAAIFLVLFAGLCGTEITRIDIRFAIMVQDVARHGIGLFSTVNSYAYTDYPAAYVLLSYLTTFGGCVMNYALLALPSAVLSSVIAVLILHIGEKAAPWTGFVSAGLFLASGGMWDSMMGFGIDVPVAAAGAVMLWTLQKKLHPGKLATIFAGLLVVLFFERGPLGFGVLAAAVGGALLWERRWRELCCCVIAGAVMLMLCAGIAYFWILRQGGRELLELVYQWQFAARKNGVGGNEYFYYFLNGLPTFSPAGLGAVAGACFLGKKLLKPPAAGWLGFALVPMLLLSVPGCKHLRYILIVVPALALLAGYGFTQGSVPEWVKDWAGKFLHWIAQMLPALLVLALAAMAVTGMMLWDWRDLPWLRWGILAFGVWALYRATKSSGDPAMTNDFLRIFLSAGMIFACGAFPFLAGFESARKFAVAVQEKAPGKISLYELGTDHDDLKFMLHVAPEKRGGIRYILDRKGGRGAYHPKMYPYEVWSEVLPQLTDTDWLVLQEGKLELLREGAKAAGFEIEIMQQGTLGHRDAFAVRLVPQTEHQGESL